VTIATNMAGRGVDILLGGNPDGLARLALRKQGIEITQATPEQWQAALAAAKEQTEKDKQIVLEQGGLFVLGTERHEARRIDNQLRGRAGRQGDPGESRFFLSLEDDLMKRFGGDRVKGFMKFAGIQPDEPLEAKIVSGAIAQAQTRVEGYNFDVRKRVLEYDDVVNKQREVIYRQRRELLDRDDLRDDYYKLLDDQIARIVDAHTADAANPHTWELEELHQRLFTLFPVPDTVTPETMAGKSLDDLENMIIEAAHAAYDKKGAELGGGDEATKRIGRAVMLYSIDRHWRRHLTDLDVLREGIGLMAIAQRDPLVEYKREAFGMWQGLQDEIQVDTIRQWFRVLPPNAQPRRPIGGIRVTAPARPTAGQPATQGQPAFAAAMPAGVTNVRATAGNVATSKPETVRNANKKPGRNDPCWCGSGRKYKDCHYKEDQLKQLNRG